MKKEMLKEIEAVIFDLDGTLVDSMWVWDSLDKEYLARFGLSKPENLHCEIEGMSFVETAFYFKEHFPIPDSIEKIMEDWHEMAFHKYQYEVPLKNGVFDFLCGCKEHGILLGIATSNSRRLVESIAAAHKINSFFDCIMTASEVEKGKPAPDIYLAVADKLKTKPSKCLVFEDIIAGIQAGKSAGMKVCAVEDKHSEQNREEKKALADYYIEDYYNIW